MSFADTNGVRTYYEMTGRGDRVLVLLHELGGSLRSWDEVATCLDDEFRILRYDLRGSGRTQMLASPFTMTDQASDLEALLDAVRVTTATAIVGSAAGSAVAVTFAARHPARTTSLVLCPPALSVSPARRQQLAARIELARREGMAAVIDQTLERSYAPAVIRDVARYQRYREQFLENDPVGYGLANLALAESTADELAPSVHCPCLLIAGRHDPLRPLDQVRSVAAGFPNALVTSIDSGHIMSVQAPEELAASIRAFVGETSSRAPAEHG